MIDYAFLLQFVVNGVAYANLLAHDKGVTDLHGKENKRDKKAPS